MEELNVVFRGAGFWVGSKGGWVPSQSAINFNTQFPYLLASAITQTSNNSSANDIFCGSLSDSQRARKRRQHFSWSCNSVLLASLSCSSRNSVPFDCVKWMWGPLKIRSTVSSGVGLKSSGGNVLSLICSGIRSGGVDSVFDRWSATFCSISVILSWTVH